MKKPNPITQAIVNQDEEAKTLAPATQIETRNPHQQSPVARDQQEHIQKTIRGVRGSELREFLEAVLQEPDVLQILGTQRKVLAGPPRYAIQYLQQAAGYITYEFPQDRKTREVMYVATLMQGLKELLIPKVADNASVDDILLTIVREVLHLLDEQAPDQSRQMRLCLGWGNEDEMNDFYALHLQKAIQHALHKAAEREREVPHLKKLQPH